MELRKERYQLPTWFLAHEKVSRLTTCLVAAPELSGPHIAHRMRREVPNLAPTVPPYASLVPGTAYQGHSLRLVSELSLVPAYPCQYQRARPGTSIHMSVPVNSVRYSITRRIATTVCVRQHRASHCDSVRQYRRHHLKTAYAMSAPGIA
eukprot:3586843-Rhodomonas_salina.7